jgi:hypothetical protein
VEDDFEHRAQLAAGTAGTLAGAMSEYPRPWRLRRNSERALHACAARFHVGPSLVMTERCS